MRGGQAAFAKPFIYISEGIHRIVRRPKNFVVRRVVAVAFNNKCSIRLVAGASASNH